MSGPKLAPVVPAGSGLEDVNLTEADVDLLSIKDLRGHLTRLGANPAGCIEKSDFQKLLKATLAARGSKPGTRPGGPPRPASGSIGGSGSTGAGATPSAKMPAHVPAAAPAPAVAPGPSLDLPDAWSVTGFQRCVVCAAHHAASGCLLSIVVVRAMPTLAACARTFAWVAF
jgi:hypothetical protein